MNVFLSHSRPDQNFAKKLADALRPEGFQPWLYEQSIEPGTNWVGEINTGLTAADIVLLLWSPDAANSFATHVEWTAALAREITDRRIRLGILMLRSCELPEILGTKQYIDGRDEQSGIAKTLSWLKARRDAGRLSGSKAPVYLPDYRPENFIGRERYLEKLRRAFDSESGVYVLSAGPGSGKSTLALHFAFEAQKDFDAIIFQTCGQRTVETIVGDLAQQLRDQLGEGVLQLAPEEKLKQIKHWLKARRSLLVLDDLWPEKGVQDLLPGAPVSVLITSRQRRFPGVLNIIAIDAFSQDETETAFRNYLGDETFEQHRDALFEFAERVQRLPIAVIVGADLLRSQFAPLDEAARGLVLEELHNEVHDVADLLDRAIAAQGETEQRLLAAGAVCNAESFWLPLAIDIAQLSREDAATARDKLVNSSLLQLVDRDRQRFQMHALLRGRLRTQADLENLQRRDVEALERLFADWEKRWGDCRECIGEIIPAAEFRRQMGESGRGAWLSYWGFALARRVGELDAALEIMQRVEESASASSSRENRYRLSAAYGNQALVLHDWGRLEEAMTLHKKEEAICKELGDVGLHVCYGNQAAILKKWGRLEEAMALHKREETICLELGDRHQLQMSYGNQAAILEKWGHLEEAMALHKKEEGICLELGDKDSLQRSYGNQAILLRNQGRFEEALSLVKEREAICLEIGMKRSLGQCYWSWGLLAKAQGHKLTAREKLNAALKIFTDLKTPRERDAVQAALDSLPS